MKKVLFSILVLVVILSSICLAAISKEPHFVLDKFKMKLGSTQAIAGILNGDYNINEVETSNPDVVEILSNGSLKAKSTGFSVISYKYTSGNDEITLTCHIEVTRYDSTFDTVSGGVTKETVFITLDLGEYKIKVASIAAAIPTLPTVTKEDAIFEGWYLEPTFETKVTDTLRFFKDTTIYPKWITQEEFNQGKTFTSSLYDDINGHWAQTAIEGVTNLGMFNGVAERTFGPEIPMTRAMAVAVIGRIENVDVSEYKAEFDDVKPDAYYAGYLAWAVENKIVDDVKDGKFRPDEEITREEVANYMANLLFYKKYNVELILDTSFTDMASASIATKSAVKTLYNAGIMQGTTINTFAPADSVTRAQMAQIFYNYYNFTMKYKG